MRVPNLLLLLLFVLFVAQFTTPVQAQFIRGDSNSDDAVNIADAIYILANLFSSGPDFECVDAADCNDSGEIDIADPTYLLLALFADGALPPPPYPGAGSDPTPDGLGDCDAAFNFITIAQATSSGAPEQTSIIRDPAAWQAFWDQHTSIFIPPPPLPPVDFGQSMVVVVLRHFNTSGYAVNIDEILAGPGGIEIYYTQSAPLGMCVVLAVLTQPHHIVEVTRTSDGDPVSFETLVDSCP